MKSLLPYNGNLEQELPIPVRLEVYKEAIKVIKSKKWKSFNLSNPSLCLLLPCILWNLKHFCQNGPKSYTWTAKNTQVGFNELNQDTVKSIDNYIFEDKNKFRLKLLKQWILELENQNKNEQTTI